MAMTPEEQAYYNQIENEIQEQNRTSRTLNNAHLALFGEGEAGNLIDKQLDMDELKEELYHLLSGHVLKRDKDGNVSYEDPEDPNLKPFNEFGVKLIMNIISFYLNKNTILSYYDIDTIDNRVMTFGRNLLNLVFTKYEDMMMTTTFEREFNLLFKDCKYINELEFEYKGKIHDITEEMRNDVKEILNNHLEEKNKLYEIMVLAVVDAVESAYRRALNGAEAKNLRTARVVSQTENLSQGGMGGGMGKVPSYNASQGQRRRLLNPTTWFNT